MRVQPRALALSLFLAACGGEAAEAPPPSDGVSGGDETPAPPAPRARALARYGCEDETWTLTYLIDTEARSCDDPATSAPLTIVQRPAETAGEPQRFAFTLASDAGGGEVCRAPSACPEQDHSFTIFDSDPPRVEWSFSLADGGVEHGSAAVLLCNDAPPPPCAE